MPRAAWEEGYGPAEHRRMDGTERARPAGRNWSGGAEGAAAGTKRGLPDSAADVEWRRSPRSSSDPNKGSWRGHRPAGYEVGEGTLAARSSTSAPRNASMRGKERSE